MRTAILLMGALLTVVSAQSFAAGQDPLQAAIWNDSDEDIIVAIQLPSRPDALLHNVQVPSGAVVTNIPIPDVEEDILAIAFAARQARNGLELEGPSRIVGLRKIFPSARGPAINSSVPILRYRSFEEPRRLRGGYPEQAGVANVPPLVAEEGHYHSRALWVPHILWDAQALLTEALRSGKPIIYQEQEQKQE